MSPLQQSILLETRRQFFGRGARGLGLAALAWLFSRDGFPSAFAATPPDAAGSKPHFEPKAKRVIYLFMSGAPPQMDLFDYKPGMAEWYDRDLPESIRNGQRLTTMTSGQTRFPIAPSIYKFRQHGRSGTWVSELLPHLATVVDDIAVVKSMWTEAINHDPAITYIQTGNQIPGRPSLGAWLSYGLGSENANLPAFVVLNSIGSQRREAQAIYSRLWGSGFLPSRHQGVALRANGDPVLFLSNPDGVDSSLRRMMLDGVARMNEAKFHEAGDPEIQARIAQYEMAFRMQASVPELTDLSSEPGSVLDLYGPDVERPGSFARNCLLARRLAERDVRCIQLFHRDWDVHLDLPGDLPRLCRDVDQACAGLIQDLKQRGLLEDTLVVWGGEFGRTIYCQGPLNRETYGRDHHPRCFTIWMAGAGVRGGMTYGETDEFSYNIIQNPHHIRDLNATILERMGLDHERLTYKHQGLDTRLTGVEKAEVMRAILT